jgi:hypothetical protein
MILLSSCGGAQTAKNYGDTLVLEGAFAAINTCYYHDTQQYVKVSVSMPGSEIRYDYFRDIGQGNATCPAMCVLQVPYELPPEKRRLLASLLQPLMTSNGLELIAVSLPFVSNSVAASGAPVSIIRVTRGKDSVLLVDLSNNYFPRGTCDLDRVLKEAPALKERKWACIYWLLNSCLVNGFDQQPERWRGDTLKLQELTADGKSHDRWEPWRRLYQRDIMGVVPGVVAGLLHSRSRLIEDARPELSVTAYEEYKNGFRIISELHGK